MAEQPRRDVFGSMITLVLILAALAAAAYGIYLLVTGKARTWAVFLIGLGLVFVPVPIVSLIGALVVMGAGGYAIYLGYTLQGALFILLGLVSFADRAKEIAATRAMGPKNPD